MVMGVLYNSMSETQLVNDDSGLTYDNGLGKLDLDDSIDTDITDINNENNEDTLRVRSGLYEFLRVVAIAMTAIVLMLSYYGWFIVGLVPSVCISAYILMAISLDSVVLLLIMTPIIWLLIGGLIGSVVEYIEYRF